MVKDEDFTIEICSDKRIFNKVGIFFDGSCAPENNLGNNMGYGFMVMGDGEIVAKGWGYTLASKDPNSSNNKAEWKAAQCALKLFLDLNIEAKLIGIRGDSNLVTGQMAGAYRIKKGNIYEDVATETMDKYKWLIQKCNVSHIYRNQNAICDALSTTYIKYLEEKGFSIKKEKVEKKKKRGGNAIYLDTVIDFGKYKGQGMTLGEIKSLYPEYVSFLRQFTTIPLVFKNKPTEQ